MESTVITPSPGLVIKGLTDEGTKVFINICYSTYMRNPHEQTDGRVRVPMSIGDPLPDFDKKGNPCLVIDTVVSEETAKLSTVNSESRFELVQLIVSGIKSKHGLVVGSLRPLKLGYKGSTVRPQRIRLEKTDIIHEVHDSAPNQVTNIPVFEFFLRNTRTGEEVNVLDLPQYMSTAEILRRNMQAFVGNKPAVYPNASELSKFDCMRIRLFEVQRQSSIKLRYSDERLVINGKGLNADSELNVCYCSTFDWRFRFGSHVLHAHPMRKPSTVQTIGQLTSLSLFDSYLFYVIQYPYSFFSFNRFSYSP